VGFDQLCEQPFLLRTRLCAVTLVPLERHGSDRPSATTGRRCSPEIRRPSHIVAPNLVSTTP
jgi:hypothetical protein